MIPRFFGARNPSEPAGPAGTRIYAIGDIHGRADLLRLLHGMIAADARRQPAPRNVAIYLGDYVDRGAQSRAVIDLLLESPLAGFEAVHLKGNHEDFMLRFLVDVSVGPNWLAFGGRETLESYGVDPPHAMAAPGELVRAQQELNAVLPRAHCDFLRGLALLHEEGDYAFVHAGVKPGVALERQQAEDLLWIREPFLESRAGFGRVIVHGHTITPVPDVRPNRIGIDTGAFMSGRLTCLVIDGTASSFLQT
ncbi:MAG TPA: metallophosphoesterase family protein [Stellaceae bacterium]|nr:metallophosphoesterase family protein [Stellaceae bacterium]